LYRYEFLIFLTWATSPLHSISLLLIVAGNIRQN
jgi:hypothetical protein